jgi:hypothetical protein
LNKILITIQGRTLILHYQIQQVPAHNGAGRTNYIQVMPSAELSRFNLKGLTPEMFCINIADMVNIRSMYSGQVENERQIPVAKWSLNYEEFLQIKSSPVTQLTHKQIVKLLVSLPGYVQETDDQYIDFEERIVPHQTGDHTSFSGYRLTIMTEEIDGNIASHAYYYLDTCTPAGWQDIHPPKADHEAVRVALENKLQGIRECGVQLTQVKDETDYAIVADMG